MSVDLVTDRRVGASVERFLDNTDNCAKPTRQLKNTNLAHKCHLSYNLHLVGRFIVDRLFWYLHVRHAYIPSFRIHNSIYIKTPRKLQQVGYFGESGILSILERNGTMKMKGNVLVQ